MDVDRPVEGPSQRRRRQDEAVGRDRHHVDRNREQRADRLDRLERSRFEDPEPAVHGQPFDGRRFGSKAAAPRPIRLGQYQRKRESRVEKSLEDDRCERRRPGKTHAHGEAGGA